MTTLRSDLIKNMKKVTGYNSRQVSVSMKRSSIRFTIRDGNVSLKTLKEFAETYEKIDRCPVSNEVLQGGNTFVFITYSEKVKQVFVSTYEKAVKTAIEELKTLKEHQLADIKGTNCCIGTAFNGCDFILYSDSFSSRQFSSIDSICVHIAEKKSYQAA